MEKIIFEGDSYILELEGKLEYRSGTEEYTVRGHHYEDGTYERSSYYEHFEGTGRIINKQDTKEKFFFTFSTPEVRFKEDKTLMEKVLAVDGRSDENKIVSEEMLYDFLCKKIIISLQEQLQREDGGMIGGLKFIFKKTVLQTPELIEAGIMTTPDAQIAIPLAK